MSAAAYYQQADILTAETVSPEERERLINAELARSQATEPPNRSSTISSTRSMVPGTGA